MANKVFPVRVIDGKRQFAVSKKSGENAKFIKVNNPIKEIDLDAFQIASKKLTIVEDR